MRNKRWIAAIFAASISTFTHAKTCNVSENTLKGPWLAANAHAPFEQMEFSIEGKQKVFNSWLHERPEVMGGSWSLSRCRLSISHPTEPSLTYNFIARLNRGKLELIEEGVPVGKFRRAKN